MTKYICTVIACQRTEGQPRMLLHLQSIVLCDCIFSVSVQHDKLCIRCDSTRRESLTPVCDVETQQSVCPQSLCAHGNIQP